MGIDVGFDFYPPLDDKEDDHDSWSSFFSLVSTSFEDDPDVDISDDGDLVFKVAEHPSLPRQGHRFRRFSSKVTGRQGAAAEFYIQQVASMAKRRFGNRIYCWSEYGDWPNMKYSWTDVNLVNQSLPREEDAVCFSTVATAVLTAFENIHAGMQGLRFKSATFPDNGGYRIEHVMSGFHTVDRLEDWTTRVEDKVAVQAYWATRANNNCSAINGSLLKVLKHLLEKGVRQVSFYQKGTCNIVQVDVASCSIRKIALKPHYVGTILEPPCVSKVPPSPDGETFHEFVVGTTVDEGIPVALDCAVAQFGSNKYPVFAAERLVPYLKHLGRHRLLKLDEIDSSSDACNFFVGPKIEACTRFAIETLDKVLMLL
ncbi:hypothetical protein ACA910_005771 [Epithemia clementina (nom. ined.)]